MDAYIEIKKEGIGRIYYQNHYAIVTNIFALTIFMFFALWAIGLCPNSLQEWIKNNQKKQRFAVIANPISIHYLNSDLGNTIPVL